MSVNPAVVVASLAPSVMTGTYMARPGEYLGDDPMDVALDMLSGACREAEAQLEHTENALETAFQAADSADAPHLVPLRLTREVVRRQLWAWKGALNVVRAAVQATKPAYWLHTERATSKAEGKRLARALRAQDGCLAVEYIALDRGKGATVRAFFPLPAAGAASLPDGGTVRTELPTDAPAADGIIYR